MQARMQPRTQRSKPKCQVRVLQMQNLMPIPWHAQVAGVGSWHVKLECKFGRLDLAKMHRCRHAVYKSHSELKVRPLGSHDAVATVASSFSMSRIIQDVEAWRSRRSSRLPVVATWKARRNRRPRSWTQKPCEQEFDGRPEYIKIFGASIMLLKVNQARKEILVN